MRSLVVRGGAIRLADLPKGVLVYQRIPPFANPDKPHGIAETFARLGAQVSPEALAAKPVDQTLPLALEVDGTSYKIQLDYGMNATPVAVTRGTFSARDPSPNSDQK